MNKYFCTFGSDENYPFGRNDYVVVMAQDMNAAHRLFMVAHPNPRKYEGADSIANFAACYSEAQWAEISEQFYKGVEPSEIIVFGTLTPNEIREETADKAEKAELSDIAYRAIESMLEQDKAETIKWARNVMHFTDERMAYFGLDAVEDELESEGIR